MYRVSNCICWENENKNISRITVRHCSKCFKASLKNIQVAEKESFSVKLNLSKD